MSLFCKMRKNFIATNEKCLLCYNEDKDTYRFRFPCPYCKNNFICVSCVNGMHNSDPLKGSRVKCPTCRTKIKPKFEELY